MAKRIISGLEDDAVIVGGIVIAGYFVAKKILPDFGADPADLAVIQEQQLAPVQDNVFSPFNEVYANWLTNVAPIDFNGYDNIPQLYQLLARKYYDNEMQVSPDMGVFGQIVAWAETIYRGLSGFLFPNDVANATYALNSIQYTWQVGAIAEYLSDVYQVDLFNILHTGAGLTIKGVAAADLASAIKRLNNLPDQ